MIDVNRTIFFSTHMTTDLDRIADYIAFIQNGRLVFQQSIHEVAENYVLVKEPGFAGSRHRKGVYPYSAYGSRI